MLPVTLAGLTLVLGAVLDLPTASAIDGSAGLRVVVPAMPYRKYLKTVQFANSLLQNRLLTNKPSVTEPDFHFALVLGVISATADRLSNATHRLPMDEYKATLARSLPFIFLDPVTASLQLSDNLDTLEKGVQKVKILVDAHCDNLDEKDCDMLVQYEVTSLGYYGARVARAFDLIHQLAREYLRFEVPLTLATNRLSGLGYVLQKPYRMAKVSDIFGKALFAARQLDDR